MVFGIPCGLCVLSDSARDDGTFTVGDCMSLERWSFLPVFFCKRKRLPADGLTLTVFTLFTTFVIYGGIMNICAMITMPGNSDISMKALRVLYISGAPYDAYHAVTAALCVFLFGGKDYQEAGAD